MTLPSAAASCRQEGRQRRLCDEKGILMRPFVAASALHGRGRLQRNYEAVVEAELQAQGRALLFLVLGGFLDAMERMRVPA